MDEPAFSVGPQLKALRQERGLTLQEVSDRCGVAVSTLSKIENGRVSGTVNTMLKIARGLGVLFDQLLARAADGRPPTAGMVRTIADRASTFPTEFYDYQIHSSELLGRQMLPLVIDVKTRQPPPRVDWSTHEGEEFLLVLTGRIDVYTEYYTPVTLGPGDSLYFDSLMRHAYVSVGEGDARVVSVSLAKGSALTSQLARLQRSIVDDAPSSTGNSPGGRTVPSGQATASQPSNPSEGRSKP